jgi:hypothetical protein
MLTDNIDVLASPLSGASREFETARQYGFAIGQPVKHINYPDTGRVRGFFDKGLIRIRWDRETLGYSDLHASQLAHVEPTASVEAAISGEAKP